MDPSPREDAELFSTSWLYQKGQKDGIESTIIWLIEKLHSVHSELPEQMDAINAQRKLIKIIAGVVMHELEEMDEEVSPEERKNRLDQAIRLGYSYGSTYPFIDDLLDSDILSKKEKQRYSNIIRTSLITGNVPPLGEWSGKNTDFIQYVHSELREAFHYLKEHQQPETRKKFFEQAYVFFQSQEVDRMKNLENGTYTNEELFIPIILKSASSRLIARSVLSVPEDREFTRHTFLYGIYNQLADDFSDMFDDLKEEAVTPYTYYLKYHQQRKDLINPFELYWTVISTLIHDVYHSDEKTRDVILDRAINSLKRFKEKWGSKKYKEVMELFTSGFPKLNQTIQKMVKKASDVDFFDKLLRDQMITNIKNDQKEKDDFKRTVETVRNHIHTILPISDSDWSVNNPIINAANYSLQGNAKRLRPIITWFMAVNVYGLDESDVEPLLKSLEYMHTASLIFDDLPAQDDASVRRGRPTVHQVYNTAIAELTGLFLTQKAVEEQASLTFDSKTVLQLIQYSEKVTEEMCKGQAMDLDSKGKQLTLEQLNRMSYYKTSLGFEASMIMPAILVQAPENEINLLKKYAHHAGIAFQSKDDLLDVEGNSTLLGKEVGIDSYNQNTTFVSILGLDGAKKEMWEHYCLAIEVLRKLPKNTGFLKQMMDYIVYRDR